MQKKGLPFMLASVVIWAVIALLHLLNVSIETKNLFTFASSCLLLPLAFMFSKIVGARIFAKSDNPINTLGFMCTMNQMLYIVIVMWVYTSRPEAMVMIYAMVFGAHLMPFAWVYDCRPYAALAIVGSIGALLVGCISGSFAVAAYMIAAQACLCILIVFNMKAESDHIES